MAEFRPPSKTLQIVDPRMKINQERINAIQIGPRNNTYKVTAADSSTAVSNVSFNTINNVQDIVDRRFLVRYFLQVDITGVGNPLTSYGVNDSLRYMPINSTSISQQLNLNNSGQSTIPHQWLDGISRYIKVDDQRMDLSSSPSQVDLLFDYSAGSGPKNVMGSYVDNSVGSPDLRGSTVPVLISEGNGVSQFRFDIIEPLFITPLTYQDRDVPGFIGLETINIQLSHSWTGENAWSHTGATTLSNFTFTMYATPQLLLNVMTPNELVSRYDPLRTYVYNSVSMNHFSTDVGSIASGATSIVAAGNIQMSAIPSRIYVFARKRKIDRLITDPDVFAQIESVSVNIGNKSALLSTATPRDLYKISVRNGYQYSYNAWRHFQGSVLCFKPSADLSLDLGEAPGLVVMKQLRISLTIRNQTANTQNYEVMVIPVIPGSLNIKNGSAIQSIGLLDPSEIFTSKVSVTNAVFKEHENLDVYGSGLFDFLRQAFKTAAPLLLPVIGDIAVKGVDALGKALKGKIKKKTRRGKGIYQDDESDEERQVVRVSRKKFTPFQEI